MHIDRDLYWSMCWQFVVILILSGTSSCSGIVKSWLNVITLYVKPLPHGIHSRHLNTHLRTLPPLVVLLFLWLNKYKYDIIFIVNTIPISREKQCVIYAPPLFFKYTMLYIHQYMMRLIPVRHLMRGWDKHYLKESIDTIEICKCSM